MTKQRPALRSVLGGVVPVLIVAVVVAIAALAARGQHPVIVQGGSSTGGGGGGTQTAPTTYNEGAPTEHYRIIGPRPAPIVYRPPGLGLARKVALVVAFYGATGTPQAMEGLTKFEELANQHGFVVAYPGSQTDPPWHGGDDVSYLRALIHHIEVTQNIDPRRIYLTGFSAGGRETYFLACQYSRFVAAIAVVSSVMRDYACHLAHPVSEMTIVASRETVNVRSTLPTAAHVAARWRAFDGCPSATPVQTQVATLTQQVWGACLKGTAVVLWVVQGGHHTWPGTYGLAPSDPDAQFSASQAIWAFFAAHPRVG